MIAEASGDDFGSYLFVTAHASLPSNLAHRMDVLLVGGSYLEAESLRLDRRLAAGVWRPSMPT